ncbi:zinc finger CCCH domain-containing protein 15-like [Hydractinia symbiolongicarpus]|uniref:zinc finger CCCH domain-containing protein 15-like n=1 Tax=Hydractinia symbiolongicarpus TaxID=13093 RepID=UPI00254AF4E8|nr:zinc finger CCCH domain-containing protein 15-like [Hydractinia symbiolongicarpus]
MPPKKNASKKTQEKVKQKIVEDKTFGLKNKKGKKQQTYIKTVTQQVQGNQKKKEEATGAHKLSKREIEKQKLEELNALFKPVQQAQKVAAGVDPKSVLCTYFKNGTCQKGNKCKFSHDLSIERKSEKRSMYDDERDEKKETMDDWDQDTLEEVIKKKHGASNTIKTEIVCKFFLDAIEKSLYGWFWSCPNGEKCIYRHALPPGFVLNKDKKKQEDDEEKVSLEEHIENERNQLTGELTPVTIQTFLAWKKRKVEEKKEKLKKEMSQKKEAFKSGKSMLKISGKEVFLFKPELADADDDEADDDYSLYIREENREAEDACCVDIDLEQFALTNATADDTKLTRVSTLVARDRETAHAPTSTSYEHEYTENDTSYADGNGISVAGGITTIGNENPPNDVVVDESLFEDLDELELEDD